MGEAPKAILESLNSHGDGIRVDFHWLNDRFGHIVSLVKNRQVTMEWRSVEDDDAHHSVFQEIHEQTDKSGNTMLFLNGASAGALWSLSVAHDDHSLVFDAAARVTGESLNRAVEYCAKSIGESKLQYETMAGNVATDSPEGCLRIMPLTEDASVPATLRWKYTIRPSF